MTNPVQGNAAVFPPLQSPLVVNGDQIATPWYLMLRAMFARTGGGTGAPTTVPAVVNDAGVSQKTATPVIPGSIFVNGSGAAGAGILLASQTAGQWSVVFNIGGAGTNVYPPVGAQVNALGINAPYPLASGKTQFFFWQTNTQIRTITLG